jgi:AcrR family transcriptional regulator
VSPAGRAGAAEVRRQRRADARAAILDAARELLERHSWHDLPVEEVTRSAGLSRTVFYRHFEDRRALLLALLEVTGAELAGVGRLWQGQGSPDPLVDVERGARGLVETFRTQGRLLQAFADAAAEDAVVRAAYEGLGEQLAIAVQGQFDDDVAQGRSAVVHRADVARALVWMNERYLLSVFGRAEASSDADAEAATAALTEIWSAVAYGHRPGPAPGHAG